MSIFYYECKLLHSPSKWNTPNEQHDSHPFFPKILRCNIVHEELLEY